MVAPRYELDYLAVALDLLEDYLESPQMFWNIGLAPHEAGAPPYPQLTLGNVLLFLQRLQRPLEPAAAARRDTLAMRLDALRQKHEALWRRKAQEEARMRTRLWAQYMEELSREAPSKAYYANEVRNRVILELLRQEADVDGDITTLQHHADQRLKARWLPGGFVWEAELEPAFPKSRFWYLYGQPK